MSQFETNVFDFLVTIFGKETAVNIFRFFIKSTAVLMYMGFLCTLPFQFVKLLYKNLKERGVI